MESLTIHPQNKEQLEAIKTLLKLLKIPFNKNTYNPEFVAKIMESEKQQQKQVSLNCKEDVNDYFKNLDENVQD